MHLDDILEKLHPLGKYQVLSWTLLAIFNCFPPAWHSFSIAFTAYYPTGFNCALDNATHFESASDFNLTLLGDVGQDPNDTEHPHCFRPIEVPFTPEEIVEFKRKYANFSVPKRKLLAEPCPLNSMRYSTDPVTSSIVTDFDLVCSREILFVIVSAVEGLGEIIGCLIFGYLSDSIGRKKAYFGAAVTLFVGGILCAVGSNWVVVSIARLIIGTGLIGMNNVGFVFASENFPPKQRTLFATLHELVWGLAVVSLAGIGYFFRGWRELCLAITLPILLVIPLWWLVKESIHWLLCNEATLNLQKSRKLQHHRSSVGLHTNSHLQEAHRIIKWIAEFNNAKVPDNLLSLFLAARTSSATHFTHHFRNGREQTTASETSPPEEEEKRCCSKQMPICFRLFATPKVRYITITVTLLWFANSLAYYGLQWSAQFLRVDFYMSYFLLAVVELPSTFVVLIIMPRIGRRWTILIFHVIAGCCCCVVPFIPEQNSDVSVAIAIFGKFAVCSSFTALYVFAVELFPTEIRGIGFGFCSLLGRLGLVVAPFVNWLGVGGDQSSAMARMLLYGMVLLLTAVLTIWLIETNNCPLADTIEQTENFAEYCAQVNAVANVVRKTVADSGGMSGGEEGRPLRSHETLSEL